MNIKNTIQCLCVAGLLCVNAMPLQADNWYNHYQNALKYAEQKNWPMTVNEILAAIEEKPAPALNARMVGLNFIDYLPYYYLGVAYHSQNMYASAQQAFEKSLEYNVISRKKDLYQNLQLLLADCRAKLSQPIVAAVNTNTHASAISHIEAADAFVSTNRFIEARIEYTRAKEILEREKNEPERLDQVNRKLLNTERLEKVNSLLAETSNYINARQYSLAEKTVHDLLAIDPQNPQALALAISIRTLQTSESKPVKPLRSEEQATSVSQLLQDGKKMFAAGDFVHAHDKFAAILQFSPQHGEAGEWIEKVDYALAHLRLQSGIAKYYKGLDLEAERELLNAEPFFAHHLPRYRPQLVRTWQFLAAIAINRLLLAAEIVEKTRSEARAQVLRIRTLVPDFALESEFFSEKMIALFNELAAQKN